MIVFIGKEGVFAVLTRLERVQGLHIRVFTSEDAFKFIECQLTDKAVMVFVGGLGAVANQIDKLLTGVESIQNLLNFFFGRHTDVAHLQNVYLGNNFPQQDPADSGFIALAIHAQRKRGVQANHSGIIGGSNLFRVGEYFRAAGGFGNKARHVVDAQNDILTRHNYGAAVGRGQDVIAGQHQHPGFYLSLH